ncbi:MAG TPA: hypothetical protein VF796_30645 [Humisphaera sp.]
MSSHARLALTRLARTLAAAALVLLPAAAARADFEPPKDGAVTEKQVTEYIGAMKDWLGVMKAAGKAVEKNQAAALGVIGAVDARFNQILTQHGFASKDEFQWVGERVWEARGAVMAETAIAQQKAGIADAQKKAAAEMAALRTRVTALEAGVKSGRRVMTDDEKKAAVESAKSEMDSANDAAKGKDEEAKSAATEAAKYEATAKAAEALAAKPPAETPADEKEAFVAAKKQEATDALAAAKEQRAAQAAAAAEAAAARAKAAGFAARMRDPEATPADELDAVRKENAEKLAAAQEQLKQGAETEGLLKQAATDMEKNAGEMAAKVNAQTLGFVRKHAAEFDAVWQQK